MDNIDVIKGLLVYSLDVGTIPTSKTDAYVQSQVDSLSALTTKLHAQGVVLMMIPVRNSSKVDYIAL